MNTPLRDELKELDLEFLHGVPVHLTDEMADQILELVASKMPEKKGKTLSMGLFTTEEERGWNAYHDSVKSILKGGTE